LARWEASDKTHAALVKNADFHYPSGWSNCCKSGTGANPMQDPLDAPLPIISPVIDAKPGAWRSRYLHITPFSYDGSTYMWLRNGDESQSQTELVVRPDPKDRFEEECRFEHVLPNF
jgi:hypothetical protein